MDIVNSYELPMIRCFNCNKPIAHLFEEYKNLLAIMDDKKKIYEILNIKNPCCREKITFPEIIIINKPDENVILGIKHKIIPKESKLTEIAKIKTVENFKTITNEEKISIPIRCTVGYKRKKINDYLYISYVCESTYIAQ
jgi:DNA-directed RNA polymerase subunit N (RpoN/RPB10)